MAKKNKSLFKYSLLAISCLFALSLLSAWVTPVQAQVSFTPTGDKPPEKNTTKTVGGGSRREGCAIGKAGKSNTSVVKLLPKSNIGLTTKQRPSIMVYVPVNTAREAFFSIQDENFNHHYQNLVQLPEKKGVVEFKIPASAPALEAGIKYQYSLVLPCGEYLEPDDPYISGWIKRVESKGNLPNQKASVELASKLAEDGVWFDALSALAELRKSEPSNQSVVNSWQQLLNSVGLNEIAQEPIVN